MTVQLPKNLFTEAFVQNVIDEACAIQSIPAPTFQETRRADYFIEQFRAWGLSDVQRDAAGNVLARFPGGSARPLVVSAHLDTVFPMDTPLELRRGADRITGPGIGDNSLGLAGAAGVVRFLKEQHTALPGDVWLAMNTGEEGLGDLRGIQAVVNRFQGEPLAYLVVEGMGLGTILHRGLGVERYKISVQTAGGHSWVDYGSPSAIHELSRLVVRLTEITLPKAPCTTLNVGVIQGGTSINTIASSAWLELDLRSEDSGALAALVSEVINTADSLRRPGVQILVERIGRRQAGQIPAKHPLVALAVSALEALGVEARLDIASTDANLPLSRGYAAICIGVTHGINAHTREELIYTAPVALGMAQLYYLITQAWTKIHS